MCEYKINIEEINAKRKEERLLNQIFSIEDEISTTIQKTNLVNCFYRNSKACDSYQHWTFDKFGSDVDDAERLPTCTNLRNIWTEWNSIHWIQMSLHLVESTVSQLRTTNPVNRPPTCMYIVNCVVGCCGGTSCVRSKFPKYFQWVHSTWWFINLSLKQNGSLFVAKQWVQRNVGVCGQKDRTFEEVFQLEEPKRIFARRSFNSLFVTANYAVKIHFKDITLSQICDFSFSSKTSILVAFPNPISTVYLNQNIASFSGKRCCGTKLLLALDLWTKHFCRNPLAVNIKCFCNVASGWSTWTAILLQSQRWQKKTNEIGQKQAGRQACMVFTQSETNIDI